jgi:(p)ppGpp synthase/HD superfamily hydrolase
LSNIVETARELAIAAHDGQLYGTGEPYSIHPQQVARMAERLGYGPEVVAACYLHDVIEDTTVTEEKLHQEFPPEVVNAVLAVTFHGKNSDEKIAQAMTHPIGHVVKFCDASCNLSNAILHTVKPGQKFDEVLFRRLQYLFILKENLPTPEVIRQFVAKS